MLSSLESSCFAAYILCQQADRSRIRALRAEPYTQKEADAAVGLRTDNGLRSEQSVASERQQAFMELEAT